MQKIVFLILLHLFIKFQNSRALAQFIITKNQTLQIPLEISNLLDLKIEYSDDDYYDASISNKSESLAEQNYSFSWDMYYTNPNLSFIAVFDKHKLQLNLVAISFVDYPANVSQVIISSDITDLNLTCYDITVYPLPTDTQQYLIIVDCDQNSQSSKEQFINYFLYIPASKQQLAKYEPNLEGNNHNSNFASPTPSLGSGTISKSNQIINNSSYFDNITCERVIRTDGLKIYRYCNSSTIQDKNQISSIFIYNLDIDEDSNNDIFTLIYNSVINSTTLQQSVVNIDFMYPLTSSQGNKLLVIFDPTKGLILNDSSGVTLIPIGTSLKFVTYYVYSDFTHIGLLIYVPNDDGASRLVFLQVDANSMNDYSKSEISYICDDEEDNTWIQGAILNNFIVAVCTNATNSTNILNIFQKSNGYLHYSSPIISPFNLSKLYHSVNLDDSYITFTIKNEVLTPTLVAYSELTIICTTNIMQKNFTRTILNITTQLDGDSLMDVIQQFEIDVLNIDNQEALVADSENKILNINSFESNIDLDGLFIGPALKYISTLSSSISVNQINNYQIELNLNTPAIYLISSYWIEELKLLNLFIHLFESKILLFYKCSLPSPLSDGINGNANINVTKQNCKSYNSSISQNGNITDVTGPENSPNNFYFLLGDNKTVLIFDQYNPQQSSNVILKSTNKIKQALFNPSRDIFIVNTINNPNIIEILQQQKEINTYSVVSSFNLPTIPFTELDGTLLINYNILTYGDQENIYFIYFSLQYDTQDVLCKIDTNTVNYSYVINSVSPPSLTIINYQNNSIIQINLTNFPHQCSYPIVHRNLPLYNIFTIALINSQQLLKSSQNGYFYLNSSYNNSDKYYNLLYNTQKQSGKILQYLFENQNLQNYTLVRNSKLAPSFVYLDKYNINLIVDISSPYLNIAFYSKNLRNGTNLSDTYDINACAFSKLLASQVLNHRIKIKVNTLLEGYVINLAGVIPQSPIVLNYSLMDQNLNNNLAEFYFFGPVESYQLQCFDDGNQLESYDYEESEESWDSICPYEVVDYMELYYTNATYFESYKYGEPIKIQNYNDYVILLSRNILSIMMINQTEEQLEHICQVQIDNYDGYIPIDFIISSDLNNNHNLYLLKQYADKINLFAYNFTDIMMLLHDCQLSKLLIYTIELPKLFSSINNFIIYENYLFLLGSIGNNTKNLILNAYFISNESKLISIDAFNTKFPLSRNNQLVNFDIVRFNDQNGSNNYSMFILFDIEMYYYTFQLLPSYPYITNQTSINIDILPVIEASKLQYIEATNVNDDSSFELSSNHLSFNLMVGTNQYIYLINMTINPKNSIYIITINSTFRGIIGCSPYYLDAPKSYPPYFISICITENENFNANVFSVLIYNQNMNYFNNSIANSSNYYPIKIQTYNYGQIYISTLPYQLSQGQNTHLLVTDYLYQFDDFFLSPNLTIKIKDIYAYSYPSKVTYRNKVYLNASNRYNYQGVNLTLYQGNKIFVEGAYLVGVGICALISICILMLYGLMEVARKFSERKQEREKSLYDSFSFANNE